MFSLIKAINSDSVYSGTAAGLSSAKLLFILNKESVSSDNDHTEQREDKRILTTLKINLPNNIQRSFHY
ncbi:hypothetical protein P3J6_121693 [Pseudoalteromonas sp. 3J6]|nr:hypothetical protein P3J6_121693 [Pseudoalteromonas sp. 3J6]